MSRPVRRQRRALCLVAAAFAALLIAGPARAQANNPNCGVIPNPGAIGAAAMIGDR